MWSGLLLAASRLSIVEMSMLTVTGVTLVLLAAVVPSHVWVDIIQPSSPEPPRTLLRGFDLLRGSLALFGAYLVVGSRWRWWRSGALDGRRRAPESKGALVALLLIVVVGLLRLYRLIEGLWADEVWALVGNVRPPLSEVVTTYHSQGQHFLFSALAHLSVSAFGEHAWSLRLPAALFGIATLWALWRFARLLTSPTEALLAMGLLTFSYQHIWFSQNARGYSALLFFAIASSYFLVLALRSQGPSRQWAAYAVTASLGMYTHLTMAFVIAGQVALYARIMIGRRAVPWRQRLLPVWSGFLMVALLTIVLYAVVLPQMPGAMSGDLSNVTRWRSPLWLLEETAGRLFVGPLPVLAALGGVACFGAGLISDWRRSGVLGLLFLVPVVFGAAAMIGLGHHLWPRFFFFAAGFGILLSVRGVFAMTEAGAKWLGWSRGRFQALATGLLLVTTAGLAASVPAVYGPKQDYEGARNFIEAERQPGDAVVAVGVAAHPFRIYYAPEWQTALTVAELEEIRRGSQRTWLLYTLPIEMENTFPDIYAAARRDFRLVRTFDGTLGGGAIYVCLAGPSGAADGKPVENH